MPLPPLCCWSVTDPCACLVVRSHAVALHEQLPHDSMGMERAQKSLVDCSNRLQCIPSKTSGCSQCRLAPAVRPCRWGIRRMLQMQVGRLRALAAHRLLQGCTRTSHQHTAANTQHSVSTQHSTHHTAHGTVSAHNSFNSQHIAQLPAHSTAASTQHNASSKHN